MHPNSVRMVLDCPARSWLEDHRSPLSPFVLPQPGPACLAYCPVRLRCPYGRALDSLLRPEPAGKGEVNEPVIQSRP